MKNKDLIKHKNDPKYCNLYFRKAGNNVIIKKCIYGMNDNGFNE
jgi:hypothetical protein